MATQQSTRHGNGFKDETGKRYNHLTAVRFSRMDGQARWIWICDCGNMIEIAGGDVRRGTTKSCGCGKVKHGGYKSPEYSSWSGMISRCHTPTNRGFKDYGGRGIVVCDRWRTSFANFLQDMGHKPFPSASIDRIDNDGNYEPDNCRWATPGEQSRNQRKTVTLTYMGKTMCVREWARYLQLEHSTIRNRLRRGWPIDKVLSSHHFFSPPPPKKKRTALTG